MNAGTNYSEPSYHNIAHDVGALEKNVEEYPFSSLAHYLLLCQYRKTGHLGFEKLLKKTALYFTNHHWLQFQLSQIKIETPENKFVTRKDLESSSFENQNQNHFAVVTDEQLNMHYTSQSIPRDEEALIPDTKSLGSHIENYYQKEMLTNDEANIENVAGGEKEFIPESQTLGTHLENITETGFQHSHEKDYTEMLHEKDMPVPDTQSLGTHVENIPEEKELSNNHEVTRQNIFEKEKTTGQPNEIENSDTTEAIAFEPLHTVDYFASQGIRLNEEALTNDKLGTQMRSFTEWLKSMKKLHASQLPEQNSLSEDTIQKAAEVSNIDTEVLTEAMAEVLIKQDKREKAIEMYNKLSLINPSKSAYFAAKIESIKST